MARRPALALYAAQRRFVAARLRGRNPRWPGLVLILLIVAGMTLTEVLRDARRPLDRPTVDVSAAAPASTDPAFPAMLSLLTHAAITGGNTVDVLLNGDGTYPRLWAELASARRSITMQMYYALPGRVTDSTSAVLCARARAGVRTMLLVDAFGAVDADHAWLRRLRACGVDARRLRTLDWSTIHSAADRSHVRAVVIDGRVGYTGGFGLADYWLGDGAHPDQWRETNARFKGPAVTALQAAFATAWREATGELLLGDDVFPRDLLASPAPGRGDTARVLAGLLHAEPTLGSTSAERFLTYAIRSARKRLYVTNSYFVPSRTFRRLLIEAAARGVDVRILTVSALSDVRTPWLAGRASYEELVTRGIRIFEYQPAMMHAKTLVVDGAWGTIGSMNFDNRSVAFNDESNLVVIDSAFAARMESIFLDDLSRAREMTPAVLAARHWWQRALERGAVLLSHLL